MPRPVGSVRSYFLEANSVISLVYSQHSNLLDVKHPLQAALVDNSWKPISGGPGGSADTQPESSRTWRDVYFQGDRVLQVSMFQNGDVTATTFLLQAKTP